MKTNICTCGMPHAYPKRHATACPIRQYFAMTPVRSSADTHSAVTFKLGAL